MYDSNLPSQQQTETKKEQPVKKAAELVVEKKDVTVVIVEKKEEIGGKEIEVKTTNVTVAVVVNQKDAIKTTHIESSNSNEQVFYI